MTDECVCLEWTFCKLNKFPSKYICDNFFFTLYSHDKLFCVFLDLFFFISMRWVFRVRRHFGCFLKQFLAHFITFLGILIESKERGKKLNRKMFVHRTKILNFVCLFFSLLHSLVVANEFSAFSHWFWAVQFSFREMRNIYGTENMAKSQYAKNNKNFATQHTRTPDSVNRCRRFYKHDCLQSFWLHRTELWHRH